MKFRFTLTILLIIFYSSASLSFAAWQGKIVNSKNINSFVKYKYYRYDKFKHFPIFIHSVLLKDNKYRAWLVYQKNNTSQSLMNLSQSENAIIAINGGFYRENFLFNGLFIYRGKRYSRFVNNKLLAAIITIDKSGRIRLLDKKQSYKGAYYAFQSGPILIDNNKLIKQDNSKKYRQRSIIVQFDDSSISLFSFSPSKLVDVSTILQKISKSWHKKILLAVNLDGGVASSFIINFKYDPVIIPEVTKVKIALLFGIK